jgi:transposase-like protein
MARKFYRYSNCFKLQVVSSIEHDGFSIEEARRHYGIAGSATIQRWLRKLGKNELLNKVVMVQTLNERDELKRLRSELKELKVAYAELAIDHKLSEKVIEVADDMFGLELKKKYAQALSAQSRQQ